MVGGHEKDHVVLAAGLRDAGPSYVRSVGPDDAVAACAQAGADVILVDVLQRQADVRRVLDAARAAGIAILVTGPAHAADRFAVCLQRGAEDFLVTPFAEEHPLLAARRVQLALQRRHVPEASTRFVPREFLDNLDRKTIADVRLGDHVQRAMTVFFSDIRDFTALSEALTPQQNFDFLNSYLSNVTPIVRAHGGFIDKYIGDGIMALFPRAAADALRAALALQKQVERYNHGRLAAGYMPIRIGVGMHRGDLILGTIGEAERMQTTVISDAVNVASRIEGLTKAFGVTVLLSGTVAEELGRDDGFKLRPLGAVKAKGKTRSVEIFECYSGDEPELAAHKDATLSTFAAGIAEFRKGLFITAGRIFARVAREHPGDRPAAYFRDRCSLITVRDRGQTVWDGAETIDVT